MVGRASFGSRTAASGNSANLSTSCFEPLEQRFLLAASPLYVIAPGEAEGAVGLPDWVYDMATAINDRQRLGNSAARITNSRVAHDAADLVPDNGSPHFLLFDWSEVSGTEGVANDGSVAGVLARAVRQRLPANNVLDVHFIGHGRGAYVVSDAIRRLGNDSGLGFVQMTALDPVYRGTDGALAGPADADWVERFYQTDDLPAGATRGAGIPAGLNVNLTGVLDDWDGRSASPNTHHEVHDWYHWTIDVDDARSLSFRDPRLDSQQTVLRNESTSGANSTRKTIYEGLNLDQDRDGRKDVLKLGQAAGFHWSRSQALAADHPFYHTGIDLVFAIDISGSMAPDLAKAKQTAKATLDRIAECFNYDVRVGLVAFDHLARTVLPLTSNRDRIFDAIDGLQSNGSGTEKAFNAVMHALDMKDGLGAWRGGTIQKTVVVIGDEAPKDSASDLTRHSVAVHAYGAGANPEPAVVYTVLFNDDADARREFDSLAKVARGTMVRYSSVTDLGQALVDDACDDLLPMPKLSALTGSRPRREGSQARPLTLNVLVRLSFAPAARFEVDYTTTDGTALAGRDFVATSGTLVFGPGETSKIISIRLVGDWKRERTESFKVELSAATGMRSESAERQAHIADDDDRAADVVFDDEGNLHQVVYSNGRLLHKVRSSDGEWSAAQKVERKKGRYQYVSLAVSPSGAPAVAYYDAYRSLLKYAEFDGQGWLASVVDRSGNAGLFCSLAFDRSGDPTIAYFDKVGRDLKLASFNRGWTSTTLADRGNTGWETELAQNPRTRRLGLAYLDRTTGAVMFGEQDRRGNWAFGVVDVLSRRRGDLSLAYDADGRAAVSYYDTKGKSLLFAQFNGSTWDRQSVTPAGSGAGSSNHLFFDEAGAPQVLYYSSPSRGVFLAEREAGVWQSRELASDVGALFATAKAGASDEFLWLHGPTEKVLIDSL